MDSLIQASGFVKREKVMEKRFLTLISFYFNYIKQFYYKNIFLDYLSSKISLNVPLAKQKKIIEE